MVVVLCAIEKQLFLQFLTLVIHFLDKEHKETNVTTLYHADTNN